MSNAKRVIDARIESAVAQAVRDPNVEAELQAANPIAEMVKEKVTPLIVHATNQEPWYQSRVTVGNYIALASTVIGPMIGRTVSPEEQALLTAVVTGLGVVAGAALSLYGRWKAKKPLGQ